jgi:hypothetical protein
VFAVAAPSNAPSSMIGLVGNTTNDCNELMVRCARRARRRATIAPMIAARTRPAEDTRYS